MEFEDFNFNYSPVFEYIIFLPEPGNITEMFKEYKYLFYVFSYWGDEKQAVFVHTEMYKHQLEDLLKRFADRFLVLETEPPTLDELLDKVSNKEELTIRDEYLLQEYSREC